MASDIARAIGDSIPHTIHGHYVRVPRWAWHTLLLTISLLVLYEFGGRLLGAATEFSLNKRVAILESTKVDKVYDLTNRIAILEAENRRHDDWRTDMTTEVQQIKSGVDRIMGKLEIRQ